MMGIERSQCRRISYPQTGAWDQD